MRNLLFLFVFSCLTLNVQAQEDEMIVWSEATSLTWDNFQAHPLENMPMNAMTSARPTIDMNASQKGETVTINYDIKTVFYPTESWAAEKNENLAFLLEHENLFFDIAELYTRKLRKRLSDYNYTGNYTEEYIGVYNSVMSERSIFQAKFANETQFGGDTKEQKKWAKQIANGLEDLEDYSDTSFTVTFQSELVTSDDEE